MSYSLTPQIVAQVRTLALVTDVPASRLVERALGTMVSERLARLTSDERAAFDAAMASTTIDAH